MFPKFAIFLGPSHSHSGQAFLRAGTKWGLIGPCRPPRCSWRSLWSGTAAAQTGSSHHCCPGDCSWRWRSAVQEQRLCRYSFDQKMCSTVSLQLTFWCKFTPHIYVFHINKKTHLAGQQSQQQTTHRMQQLRGCAVHQFNHWSKQDHGDLLAVLTLN